MVWWWWIAPAAVVLLGGLWVLGGLGATFRGEGGRGLRGLFAGSGVMGVGALAAALGLNVQTYHRLSDERPVATIELHQVGPQLYKATVTEAPGDDGTPGAVRTFDVHGDQWRLEARVLKWKPWAAVLGLDSQYRLERFSGRYAATTDELNAKRTVVDLGPTGHTGVDVVPVARRVNVYKPMVDIESFGNGVYMPMADGARYQVSILSSGGLLPRTDNDEAAQAVASWTN